MTHRSGYKALTLLLSIMFLFMSFLSASNTKAENYDSLLDIGSIVNKKMKYLSTDIDPENETQVSLLKSIRMANSLPDAFLPSEENTVSTADSAYPVYIFFDNKDDAGIMYFYTKGNRIIVHPDSAFMFYNFPA